MYIYQSTRRQRVSNYAQLYYCTSQILLPVRNLVISRSIYDNPFTSSVSIAVGAHILMLPFELLSVGLWRSLLPGLIQNRCLHYNAREYEMMSRYFRFEYEEAVSIAAGAHILLLPFELLPVGLWRNVVLLFPVCLKCHANKNLSLFYSNVECRICCQLDRHYSPRTANLPAV